MNSSDSVRTIFVQQINVLLEIHDASKVGFGLCKLLRRLWYRLKVPWYQSSTLNHNEPIFAKVGFINIAADSDS